MFRPLYFVEKSPLKLRWDSGDVHGKGAPPTRQLWNRARDDADSAAYA
jgi:hypothetical protein